MEKEFKNKVVLITGASRGLGKATALLFAEKGAKVVVNYVNNKKAADEVIKEIEKLGSEAYAIQCNVGREEEIKKMIEESITHFGQIDILVNNAGIVYDVPFFEKTTKEFKETIDVNLMGTIIVAKEVAKHMKEKNTKGNIINISSTNGINCFHPDSMDYDITKAGVIMFTKDLAIELAPEIRVNCIAPGWFDTDINKDLPKKFIENEEKKIYLKRFGKPKELAEVICFIASEKASFVNGSIIKVDGGYGGWYE